MGKERPASSLLEGYIPFVRGLAEMFGPDCEVLLHDVATPESSVIACENTACISGRAVGAPMTAFGRQLIASKEYAGLDGVYNFYTTTGDGKLLKCSTLFIRDAARKLVGMICVNMDVTKFTQLKDALDSFLAPSKQLAFDAPPKRKAGGGRGKKGGGDGMPLQTEVFYKELGDVWEHLFLEIKKSFPTTMDRLTPAEVRGVIQTLDEQGFFMMKGAVNILAREIGRSPCTVYHHLRKYRRQKGLPGGE